MSLHPAGLLDLFALGAVSPDEAHEVENHLAGCAACAQELAARVASLDALALGLEPAKTSPAARERLLAEVAGRARYAPFSKAFSQLFDLSREASESLLEEAALRRGFEPAPVSAGALLKHFAAGPRANAFDAGFVVIPAGAPFPHHRHEGAETTLVLEGACVDLTYRRTVRPGETLVLAAGSAHAFEAAPGDPLVFAVLLGGPVEF